MVILEKTFDTSICWAYTSGQKHQEAIREASDWIQKLAQSGYLDILSLGTLAVKSI